ncbi:MAG TPA: DUF481 domain-containing protein [Terriglobales bacterium]|nr:DUF481 domain-containing protein [Terriglobales bacterium]
MKRILVLIACMVMIAAALRADEVVLQNGDHITGTVTRLDKEGLHIKSPYLGEVKMPMSAVKSMIADNPVHMRAGQEDLNILTLDADDTYVRVETVDRTMVNLPRGTVNSLLSGPEYEAQQRLEHAGFFDEWGGSANAGFTAARGNSGSSNLSLGLDTARVTNHDKLAVYFNSLFAQNSAGGQTVTNANTIRSGVNYSVNVSDRMFTFGFTNFETNALQKLDLRNVIGGGMGVRLAQSPHGELELFSGGSLNQEFYSAEPGRRSGEALLGQEIAYNLTSRTTFSERLNLFPNLTDPGEYRVTMDSSALLKLNHWMGWQVSLSNIYVSNPPLGAQNNDVLLTTGIRFSLGQEHPFKPHSKIVDVLK